MDGRWALLTLVVAAVAAIRLRRRGADGAIRPTVDRASGDQASGGAPASGARAPGEQAYGEQAFGERTSASSGEDPAEGDRPADRGAHPGRDRAEDHELEPVQGEPFADEPLHDEPVEDEGAFDVESIGAALERVWAEHAHDADTILDARLRQLVDRRVPVRGLGRAPGGRAVRVAFADGTVLLCRGSGQGDFGRLGLALHRRSVRLAAFAHVQELTRLEFAWSPDHRLAAVAVGLDQPD